MNQTFVDVVLPLALPSTFSYEVPDEFRANVGIGKRVIVQFGKQKIYSALVVNIHNNTPQGYTPKPILDVIDELPVVNIIQIKLWQWIAEYYLCTIGEVMNAAFPSAMKLQSETRIILNPQFNGNYENLTDREYLVTEALELENSLSLSEISKILSIPNVLPIVKKLLEKQVIYLEEEIEDTYKPKLKSYVVLAEQYSKEASLKELFDTLEKRAHKQLEVLMRYVQLTSGDFNHAGVLKSDIQNVSTDGNALRTLIKKGIFDEYTIETDRLRDDSGNVQNKNILNVQQQQSLDEIKLHFTNKDVTLLHGITGSGKTEVYIHLIEETLSRGGQVLYLLPEIALTTQIISRLKKFFGNSIGIYHSGLNEMERTEVWKKTMGAGSGEVREYKVILGARSALFLPYNNLQLIIVDEEHETSFKQFDPNPRYHARDAAIYLARLHGAKVLLGSATPSVESYNNAEIGKYALVELLQRHGGAELPTIEIIDIAELERKKLMKSYFSPKLIDSINTALENKEQVILFQNRRGFSPMLECKICGWVPHCIHCDVSLTYHKHKHELRCHYCGYSQKPVSECKACKSTDIQMQGFGTERVEEELAIFFPGITIRRLDYDSTRNKNAYKQIISDFEEGNIQVLVGTQMITKGLDFDNVSVVGILNADQMFNQPDFRAFERSYQLMVQVAGRSGRKDKKGQVFVQTRQPNHPVIKQVVENAYKELYQFEIEERTKFKYPPFYRLVEITIKHKDINVLNDAASQFAKLLRAQLGSRVLGPEFPLISRIKGLYIKTLLIKIEKEVSAATAKARITETLTRLKQQAEYRSVVVQLDVDPQ